MLKGHLSELRIGFVGGGTMAHTIIQTLINSGDVLPGQIIVSNPGEEKRWAIRERLKVEVIESNCEVARESDIIVLAVKPQVLIQVFSELVGQIRSDALVFSVVAGIPIHKMISSLEHSAVIRTMPNTPAQIGEGITVWTKSEAVSEQQIEQARTILGAMGEEIYVSDEGDIDMATALSGTGPTYVFMLMEALVDAAVHLGFSRSLARRLVERTVVGSVQYAEQSNLHLAQLRNMVTSPGGTSAEAIYQLEKGGMRTVLSKAVWAAYQKSRVLGERAQEPLDAPLRVNGNSVDAL